MNPLSSAPPRSSIFRSGAVLTIGRVAVYGLSFVRNIILARALTKADYGLAATFGMTISLLEFATRMSFGPQCVQAEDGDTEIFQATSHTFQFVVSVIAAALMVLVSWPTASLLRVPDITWAFAALALIPLAKSLEDLDVYRQQREMAYGRSVICEVVPQALATIAAWPLCLWFKDFKVIVILMVFKAAAGTSVTHLLSRRKFRLGWNQGIGTRLWLFGWPLLLNGAITFAAQQGDQLLVGSFLSLTELGTYALIGSLVSVPWFVCANVGTSLMLPVLSRTQGEGADFRTIYRSCLQYAATAGVLVNLPLIVCGQWLVSLFFGSKYTDVGLPMALLAASYAVRFLRLPAAVASMARSDTRNELYSTVARGVSLPLAAASIHFGGGLVWVAASALVGEVCAAVVSIYRLRARQSVPVRESHSGAAFVLIFMSLGLGAAVFVSIKYPVGVNLLVIGVLLLVAAGSALRLFEASFRKARLFSH